MIQDIEPKHLYNEWKKNAVPKKSSAVVQFRGQDLLCRRRRKDAFFRTDKQLAAELLLHFLDALRDRGLCRIELLGFI